MSDPINVPLSPEDLEEPSDAPEAAPSPEAPSAPVAAIPPEPADVAVTVRDAPEAQVTAGTQLENYLARVDELLSEVDGATVDGSVSVSPQAIQMLARCILLDSQARERALQGRIDTIAQTVANLTAKPDVSVNIDKVVLPKTTVEARQVEGTSAEPIKATGVSVAAAPEHRPVEPAAPRPKADPGKTTELPRVPSVPEVPIEEDEDDEPLPEPYRRPGSKGPKGSKKAKDKPAHKADGEEPRPPAARLALIVALALLVVVGLVVAVMAALSMR